MTPRQQVRNVLSVTNQWVLYAMDKVCRPTKQSKKFLRFFTPRKKQHFSYFGP